MAVPAGLVAVQADVELQHGGGLAAEGGAARGLQQWGAGGCEWVGCVGLGVGLAATEQPRQKTASFRQPQLPALRPCPHRHIP